MGEISFIKKSNLTRFYEGLVPLYVICRYAGIFPLKARLVNDEIVMDAHKKDRIYFFSYVGAYILLSAYATYSIMVDQVNYIIVPRMLVLIESIVILALMFMTMFFCYFYRKVIVDCVKLLAEVDASLQTLDVHIDYSQARRHNFYVFGVMLLSTMIRTMIMMGSVRVDFIQQVTLFIATFIKSLSKYEFVAMLLPITDRFIKINNAILSYSSRSDNPKLVDNLYTICRLHFKLCNISRMLNAGFAFQLLSSLGVSLTDILFQSFYFYTITAKKLDLATGPMIASPVIWLVDEFFEIFLLVNACSNTCDNANSTPVLVHELRNSVKNTDVDVHIQMYSLQMLHQRLEFTALGFFSIDYSLMYSILGAVTTYLVIFIQFDQSSSATEEVTEEVPRLENCTVFH